VTQPPSSGSSGGGASTPEPPAHPASAAPAAGASVPATAAAATAAAATDVSSSRAPRRRLRDAGIHIGRFPPGKWNAITDVKGVRVGHQTLIAGDGPLVPGRGPVRTGVTAIIPHDNIFHERVLAGAFVLNGAGEVAGLTQVTEWGLLETPILLANTMSVGKVSDAAVKWMIKHFPGIGGEYDVVIPVVGECDDSWLNDAAGRHIRSDHVYRAIEGAQSGPVPEGSVGAGTGMITCGFKAGIGTASRRVPAEVGVDMIGVLVLTNFGLMRSLRVDGVPVGEQLEPYFRSLPTRTSTYGSIITVVATDAPLLPSQLTRLCKRAALGIGRTGSYAAHGSGEILISFSTANKLPRATKKMTARIEVTLDTALDRLYEAVVECTEEAILNALCMADEMTGQGGNFAPALPLADTLEIYRRYRPVPPPEPGAPAMATTPHTPGPGTPVQTGAPAPPAAPATASASEQAATEPPDNAQAGDGTPPSNSGGTQ
jgi:D-aminopeptidase